SIVYVAYRIFYIYNIHKNFRDDQLWNIPLIRRFRNWKYDRYSKSFEHLPIGIPPELVCAIEKRGFFSNKELREAVDRNNTKDEMKLSISAVYKSRSWTEADKKTACLAMDFLHQGAYVQ